LQTDPATAPAALDKSGRRYRIAHRSEAAAGPLAAARADPAIAPLPVSLVDDRHRRPTERDGFGAIDSCQPKLQKSPDTGSAAQAFADHMRESFAGTNDGSGRKVPYPSRR